MIFLQIFKPINKLFSNEAVIKSGQNNIKLIENQRLVA